jgi:hypothetical protein
MIRVIIGILLMAAGVFVGALLYKVHWILGFIVGSFLLSLGFSLIFR